MTERGRITTDLGDEVQCADCGEFWPEDREFYFIYGGKAHSYCKACYRANEKVIAKTERWRDQQRKRPAPPPPEPIDWRLLTSAIQPQPTTQPAMESQWTSL
jgi:hypothetical protein